MSPESTVEAPVALSSEIQRVPAAHRVPVETWRSILEAVIDVEELFDPYRLESRNVTETEQIQNLNLWKESEKRRRIIASVCRSWRAYADDYGRRLIRWDGPRLSESEQLGWDVKEQSVVKVAICTQRHASFLKMLEADAAALKSLTALHLIAQGDGGQPWDADQRGQFITGVSALPNLQLLHLRCPKSTAISVADLSKHLTNLISLSVSQLAVSTQPWTFSHLQILECDVGEDEIFPECHLPALRHFSAKSVQRHDNLFNFLQLNGLLLETLRLPSTRHDMVLPEDIWAAMPNLHTICANLFSVTIPPLPFDRDWTIRIIHTGWATYRQSLPLPWMLRVRRGGGPSPYVSCLELSFDIPISWKDMVGLHEADCQGTDLNSTFFIGWGEACDKAGLILRDTKGMSLADGRRAAVEDPDFLKSKSRLVRLDRLKVSEEVANGLLRQGKGIPGEYGRSQAW